MFHEGDIVLLYGLKSKPSWNGKKGKIMGSFQWQQARYPVQIIMNINNNYCDNKEEEKSCNTNLSALIKPSNLKLISKNKNNDNVKETLFEIKFINKEKRFGVFATKDIPSGTMIIKEIPIITLPKEIYRNNKNAEEWINKQFELLSTDDKQKILKLHNNMNDMNDMKDTDNDCIGIYRTNAYLFTDNERYESGLFLIISRINHSCFPNAQFIDDTTNGMNGIVALFGINRGEEITHSYIDLDLFMADYQQRQKYIVENYGFVCKCNECELFKKRDEFRKQYKSLEDEMEKGFEEMNAEKILKYSLEMVNMIKNNFNGYPPLLSQSYMKLAEAKLHLGQYDDVVNYMKRSAKLDLKYYGDHCDLKDILQCKILLPTKYQNAYPWDHIFGKSKPNK